jgi:hypothetical protein
MKLLLLCLSLVVYDCYAAETNSKVTDGIEDFVKIVSYGEVMPYQFAIEVASCHTVLACLTLPIS